jgi:hypothetical protein
MNELSLKLVAIFNEKLSKQDKIIKLINATSGLDITALNSDQTNNISKHHLAINRILRQYPIKTFGVYEYLSG